MTAMNHDDPRRILERADEARAKATAAERLIRNFRYDDEVKLDAKKGVFSFFSRYATSGTPTATITLDDSEKDLFLQWLRAQRSKYYEEADKLEAKIGVKE